MYFLQRIESHIGPDTRIEIWATTRSELVRGVAATIEREIAAGEIVTWPDSRSIIAPPDADGVREFVDGDYHRAAVCLRFT